jgi:low affinity Fe/Cu permease
LDDIKLDELLRVTKDALNALLSLDNLDQTELCALRKKYTALGQSEVEVPVKD